MGAGEAGLASVQPRFACDRKRQPEPSFISIPTNLIGRIELALIAAVRLP
jgi:hypothetical protein